MNEDDLVAGMKVVGRTLGVIAFCAALAAAWACSSVWMSMLVFLVAYIAAIIVAILATLAFMMVTPNACEAVGRGARVVADKVGGMFGSLRARFA